jgi:ABC-type Mn2+/Zn2+ transport system ATPase subunit
MHNLIEVQGLSIGYEKKLLSHLNFTIARKEILVVLGTNGVGKSTLMKTLLRLIPWHEGRVSVFAESIGLMPQLRPIQESLPMATEDFLDIFLWKSALWKQEVVNFLKLKHYLKKPLHDLSCGLWQRVNLAQALASQPELLFLDEPTQGLDIEWQKMFYEHIAQYARNYHAGICCISHDTLAISRCAHKVLCLDHQPSHDSILKKRAQSLSDREFLLYQHHHDCQGGGVC